MSGMGRGWVGPVAVVGLGGAALGGYLVIGAMLARRTAAAAELEAFPLGLSFTLENPDAPRERTLRYLAVGDSTVQGIGASGPTTTLPYRIAQELSLLFRRVELRNIGVTGATTRDVVRDQVPQIAGFAPDLVTISAGANDVSTLRPLPEYLANIDRILNAVDAQPGAQAVLLNVPALDTAPLLSPLLRALIGAQSRRFNAALPPILRGHRVVPADIYHGTRALFAADESLFARDGYHPSDSGYMVWAEAAAPAIARAVAGL
jgi:acyl-CoA thioesterase-1